jgi:hypothetical protein
MFEVKRGTPDDYGSSGVFMRHCFQGLARIIFQSEIILFNEYEHEGRAAVMDANI